MTTLHQRFLKLVEFLQSNPALPAALKKEIDEFMASEDSLPGKRRFNVKPEGVYLHWLETDKVLFLSLPKPDDLTLEWKAYQAEDEDDFESGQFSLTETAPLTNRLHWLAL